MLSRYVVADVTENQLLFLSKNTFCKIHRSWPFPSTLFSVYYYLGLILLQQFFYAGTSDSETCLILLVHCIYICLQGNTFNRDKRRSVCLLREVEYTR